MSTHPDPDFVCPACKGELDFSRQQYHCHACERQYPVLFGIADFRLRSDRYLTLEQERDKAQRLHDYAQSASFEQLVAYYYEITDDVPPELAARYQAYIHNSPVQAQTGLQVLQPDHGRQVDSLLDAGCGAGGMLVAAGGQFAAMTGVDIALRWLVIAQKRLQEQQIEARLVCADVEQLPFRQQVFSHVAMVDVLEHVYQPPNAVDAIYRVLKPGGRLWLTASNRYCIGPHPLTRIWAIGYLPAVARRGLLRWLRGVDSLRYTWLTSPLELRRWCHRSGFSLVRLAPRQLVVQDLTAYPIQDRVLMRLYLFLLQFTLFRLVLLYAGPAFEMNCEK